MNENAAIHDHVKSTLRKMLNQDISLVEGCKILSELEEDGYDFIPIVFVGYDSELDEEWKLDFYRDRIIEDVKKLLAELENAPPGQNPKPPR